LVVISNQNVPRRANMIIDDDVKTVVEGSAFLSLVTLGADGIPHPIIAGKGEVSGENIIFQFLQHAFA
jgi:hypothetical protein